MITETHEHHSKKIKEMAWHKETMELQRQNGDFFAKYRQRAKAVVEDLRWKINCHWHMHAWAAATIRKYETSCENDIDNH